MDIFLRFSRRLLVLWSPEYLTRLWCVYELATFVKLHPDGASRIDFMPSWMPTFILFMSTMLSVLMPFGPILLTGPIYALSSTWLGPYWCYGTLPKIQLGPLALPERDCC